MRKENFAGGREIGVSPGTSGLKDAIKETLVGHPKGWTTNGGQDEGAELGQSGEHEMQNESERFGLSALCVPPSLAGLRPGKKIRSARVEIRNDLHKLPGFRHAETFGDTEYVLCVM